MSQVEFIAEIQEREFHRGNNDSASTSRLTIRHGSDGVLTIECENHSCIVFAEDLLRAIRALESANINFVRDS